MKGVYGIIYCTVVGVQNTFLTDPSGRSCTIVIGPGGKFMREQMHYDTGRKNVVSEHYDEIVFSDPINSYIMYNLLNKPQASSTSDRTRGWSGL